MARIGFDQFADGIYEGVTRSVAIELARGDGIEVVERPFTVEEARAASEVALSSTSS